MRRHIHGVIVFQGLLLLLLGHHRLSQWIRRLDQRVIRCQVVLLFEIGVLTEVAGRLILCNLLIYLIALTLF